MSTISTGLLYYFIFFSTTLLAYSSQQIDTDGIVHCKRAYFVFAFLIHWVFIAFTKVGVDHANYIAHIVNACPKRIIENTEFIMELIYYLLKIAFPSPETGIFILKTITIILFYVGFWMIRKKVNLGLSMLAYNSLLYLTEYCIIAMLLAIAIFFISFIRFLEGRSAQAIVLTLIAGLIHNTCFILLPLYLFIIFLNQKQKRIRFRSLFLLIILCIICYNSIDLIHRLTTTYIIVFRQYKDYNLIDLHGIGVIVTYFLIIYFGLLIYLNCEDYRYCNMAIIFSISCFFVAMLGYKISVVARMRYSFFPIYSILIPGFIFAREQKYKKRSINEKSKGTAKHKCSGRFEMSMLMRANRHCLFDVHSDKILWTLFLLITGVLYVYGHLLPDSTADLQHYMLYWPF